MKCIYCSSTGPFSEEHVIPRAFGEFRNFAPLINKICRCCNNAFGRFEEQFARCGLEAFFRHMLRIEGRKTHEKVNSFQRGSAGAKAIEWTGSLPEDETLKIFWEPSIESHSVRESEQIIIKDEKGKCYAIRIPVWMQTNEQFMAEVRKTGIEGKIFYDRLFCDENQINKIKKIIGNCNLAIEKLPAEEGISLKESRVKATVTKDFFRAIAKVAFHYFLSVSGNINGDEEYFYNIRNYIKNGGNETDLVSQSGNPIILFPRPNMRPKYWGHIFLYELAKGFIRVRMQFFIGPTYDPIIYVVKLSTDPISDNALKSFCGYYLRYHENLKTINGFAGEAFDFADIFPAM